MQSEEMAELFTGCSLLSIRKFSGFVDRYGKRALHSQLRCETSTQVSEFLKIRRRNHSLDETDATDPPARRDLPATG